MRPSLLQTGLSAPVGNVLGYRVCVLELKPGCPAPNHTPSLANRASQTPSLELL